ncbi:unnamed protein product, partial [Phaeothamnion confervicola]
AAGGVFLSAALVHMLPESSRALDQAWSGGSTEKKPFGGLLAAMGFLLVLCIDHGIAILQHSRAVAAATTATATPRLEMSVMAASREEEAGAGHPMEPLTVSGWHPVSESPTATFFPRDSGARKDDVAAAGYHHHHYHGAGLKGDGLATRLAMLAALCFHSVMEGLGVGAAQARTWGLLTAIAAHKGLAAYALGSALMELGSSGNGTLGGVLLFSSMTPLGIGIGQLLGGVGSGSGNGEADGAIANACVALASGTFLYVSLMEVLPRELADLEGGAIKLVALMMGFGAMTMVGLAIG